METPKVTKTELIRHLRGLGLSGMQQRRIEGVLRFMTIEEFETSSSLKWDSLYKGTHKGSKYGLGKTTCKTLAALQTWISNQKFGKRVDEQTKETEEKRMASPEVQAKITEAKEAVENPVFTRKQIKALSDMMEFCELETVNLRTIAEFFKAFGVKNPFVGVQKEEA